MKIEFELDNKLVKRIDSIVKKGNYKSRDEFLNRAAETLLMAEDRTKLISGMFRK